MTIPPLPRKLQISFYIIARRVEYTSAKSSCQLMGCGVSYGKNQSGMTYNFKVSLYSRI